MKMKHLFVGAAFALASLPSIASAQTLGIDFNAQDASIVVESFNTWTLGYAFQANNNTSVIGLGTWNNGVVGDVQVGLWDSSQNLLASTTVNSSSNVVGNASWLFQTISAVNIFAGQTYYVGSYGQTNYTYAVNPVTVSSDITYLHDAWANGGLNFPFQSSGSFADHGFAGGNVMLGTAVPEPGAWALMIMGVGATGAVLRRRRREQAALA